MAGHLPSMIAFAKSLDAVPLEELHTHVWRNLPPSSHRDLRQACRRLRCLGDQLITNVTLEGPVQADQPSHKPAQGYMVSRALAQFADLYLRGATSLPALTTVDAEGASTSGAAADTSGSSSRTQLADGHDSMLPVARHMAGFLGRLTGLKTLHFNGWGSAANLIHMLRPHDACSHSSLTSLTLHGSDGLTMAAVTTVHAVCPNLKELHINYSTFDGSLELQAPLFQPLHGGTLTWLDIAIVGMSGMMLASVAGLRHLRRLDILDYAADDSSFAALQHFSRLTALTHAKLALTEADDEGATSSCGRMTLHLPLSSLTQLTHLHLPYASGVPGDEDAQQLAAALSQLKGLQSLELCDVVVGDALLVALNQLNQLTHLSVHSFDVTTKEPGHLSQLRELRIQEQLEPPELLRTLLPLRPLACLRSLQECGAFPSLRLWVGTDNEEEAEETAEALTQVAQILSGAAHLRLRLLELKCDVHKPGSPIDRWPLPIRRIAAALRPLTLATWLKWRLNVVTLSHWDGADLDWLALGEGLPDMKILCLHSCDVSDASLRALATMVEQLPGLHNLEVYKCTGRHGAGAERQRWRGSPARHLASPAFAAAPTSV